MFVVVPVLFFLPGLLVSAVLGLRGWRLAGLAPAVTFGLVATGGPVLNALGVAWSLLTGAIRLWARVRPGEGAASVAGESGQPARRALWEHLVVGGGVLLGTVVG